MRAFPPEARKYPLLPPYLLRQVNTTDRHKYLSRVIHYQGLILTSLDRHSRFTWEFYSSQMDFNKSVNKQFFDVNTYMHTFMSRNVFKQIIFLYITQTARQVNDIIIIDCPPLLWLRVVTLQHGCRGDTPPGATEDYKLVAFWQSQGSPKKNGIKSKSRLSAEQEIWKEGTNKIERISRRTNLR